MASIDDNTKLLLLLAISIVAIIVILFEVRTIQRKRLERLRNGKRRTGREDAHNAISTTKNLIRVFSGRGVNTAKAESILIMARQHLDDRDFSGAKRYADAAKKALMEAKKEHDETALAEETESEEDAVAIADSKESMEESPPISEEYDVNIPEDAEDSAALTYTGTKLLTEKFPPNYLEARFTMTSAEEMISDAEELGKDMGLARHFLERAAAHFDAGRLSEALACAVKSRKAVEGEEILVKQSEMDEITAIFDGEVLKMVRVYEVSGEPEAEGPSEPLPGGKNGVGNTVETGARKTCPKCGHPIEEGDKFCPNCGERIAVIHYCPQCGLEVKAGDRFCRNCGTRL